MNAKTVLAELEALGTAQNRKIYARHGASEPMFGVSYANLYKLRKRIETDHALGLALWKSGNHDARQLAAMIVDGDAMKVKELESWLADCKDYGTTNAVAEVAARTKGAEARAIKWMKSKKEWMASAGWNLLAKLLANGHDLDKIDPAERIAHIEANIHGAKNRVRHNMNGALIALGTYAPKMKTKAVAAAKRIGKVDVDHGETSCKTPDAAAYIVKAAAHHAKKKKKKKAKRARPRARG